MAEPDPKPKSPTLAQVRRNYILAILRECGWNVTAAARVLDIDRCTIYRELRMHGITPGSERAE